jgi:hypothetical protein
MYMGTAWFVKHPGKEDFIPVEGRAADRAFPFSGPASFKTIDASFNMHKPAPAIPRIGKGR